MIIIKPNSDEPPPRPEPIRRGGKSTADDPIWFIWVVIAACIIYFPTLWLASKVNYKMGGGNKAETRIEALEKRVAELDNKTK